MAAARARQQAGLTLTETMVAAAVFGLTVVGFVYCQMFGMQQDELVNSKLGASDLARMTFNDLGNNIRAAKSWQIGNGNLSSFTGIPLGTNQHGTALKLSLTADTNQYYLYYFDTNNCQLLWGHSGSPTTNYLAQYLTNTMYFQALTCQGSNQTSLTYKGVVDVVMQFCQYQYPLTKVGPGYYYDYYKMEMRVTPHVPDGP
jgi:hypothetical protein